MARYVQRGVLGTVVLVVVSHTAAWAGEFNASRYQTSFGAAELPGLWDSSVASEVFAGMKLVSSYQHRLLSFTDRTNNEQHALLDSRFSLDLVASLALAERLLIGVDIPLHVINTGDTGFVPLTAVDGFALGELRVGAKARLLGGDRGFGLAIGADVSLPTAPEHSWTGAAGVGVTPRLVLDWRQAELLLSANFYYAVRPEGQLTFLTADDELGLALGARLPLWSSQVAAVAELHLATQADAPFGDEPGSDYLEGLLGVAVDVGADLQVTAAAGTSMLTGYGNPDVHVIAQLAWQPVAEERQEEAALPEVEPTVAVDSDHDGIPDENDRCPEQAEDVDSFEDKDGCPETDNDNDGIPDEVDRCRDVAEDEDGCQDEDGCPEPASVCVRREQPAGPYQMVYFPFASSQVPKWYWLEIYRLAAEIKNSSIRVTIAGHTDSVGEEPRNQNLSMRRARAVARMLVFYGVPRQRLKVVGFGETKPLVSEEGKQARNRRVEIYLGEMP